jgi:hypothetical protein
MGLAPVTVLIMLLWWFGTQFVVIALIVLMSIGVDWAWDRSEARARGKGLNLPLETDVQADKARPGLPDAI